MTMGYILLERARLRRIAALARLGRAVSGTKPGNLWDSAET
jgi:hypothetical protein